MKTKDSPFSILVSVIFTISIILLIPMTFWAVTLIFEVLAIYLPYIFMPNIAYP